MITWLVEGLGRGASASPLGAGLAELACACQSARTYPSLLAVAGAGVRTTAADGEHVSLARYQIQGQALDFTDTPPWDVVASGDGRTIVWTVNQDGRSVLHARCRPGW